MASVNPKTATISVALGIRETILSWFIGFLFFTDLSAQAGKKTPLSSMNA